MYFVLFFFIIKRDIIHCLGFDLNTKGRIDREIRTLLLITYIKMDVNTVNHTFGSGKRFKEAPPEGGWGFIVMLGLAFSFVSTYFEFQV